MIRSADFVKDLNLLVLSPSTHETLPIDSADFNRPGMQFSGFYDYFAYERPQVIGKVEMTYLQNLSAEARRAMFAQYFSYAIPCVICCRGMRPPADLVETALAHNVPVYLTEQVTTKFSYRLVTYLNRVLAPHVTQHGVLVDVYGIGVLITGESGVGKSETALELVKRGHQLVADDAVDICRIADDRLIGTCPEMIRHLMEVRGIGLIDVKSIFGIGAVETTKSIDLVVRLEQWVEGKEYDRLGLQEQRVSILGVKIPEQLIPVRPGRNLAIIIEVSARNLSLNRLGFNAAQELDRRLNLILQSHDANEFH